MNATHIINRLKPPDIPGRDWPTAYPFAVVHYTTAERIALFTTEANAKRFLRILEGRERRKERRKKP